jgi:hypothetical protein
MSISKPGIHLFVFTAVIAPFKMARCRGVQSLESVRLSSSFNASALKGRP